MTQTPPKTLTSEQAKKLLEALRFPGKSPTAKRRGIRDYTIALLMLDAGLRVGEVVQLRKSDLSYASMPGLNIIVNASNTKTNTERTIPISARLHTAIALMLQHVWNQANLVTSPYAFINGSTNRPLTTRQIERQISTAALQVLNFEVNPHMLRHTFATRLMQRTNIRVVQQLLGHKSLSSTQIYTHPNADDLEKAIGKLDNDATQEKT